MKRGTTQPLFKSRRRPARTANRSLYIDEKGRAMFRARASVFAATVRESERVCAVSPMLYTHDGNKNVSELVSLVDEEICAHYEYAPFGVVRIMQGEIASANPWRFSSEYAENDTSLVYYNYRHYRPLFGRWCCRDMSEEDSVNYCL
ncbi:MAG: hypothetical protein ILO34_00930 [Kiritimatiellae bacterium]|nr:hypothetical protein [Kiritimatiellia bacterium]